GHLGMGQQNYVGSTIGSEYFRHFMMTVSEADMAAVVAGAPMYSIQPNVEEFQLPVINYSEFDTVWHLDGIGITSISADPTKRIDGTTDGTTLDPGSGALVTFSETNNFTNGVHGGNGAAVGQISIQGSS